MTKYIMLPRLKFDFRKNYFLICFYVMLGIGFQSCSSERGAALTEDQLKIVNYVIDDVFENLTYELDCKIDPILRPAKNYGGDFSSVIESELDKLDNGVQLLENMNRAGALQIKNIKDIDKLTYVTPSLMTKTDTIPFIPDRRIVTLKMSTIGCDDTGSECVMIAERIFSTKNKTRFTYFLKRNDNGEYLPVEKKTEYSYK